MCLHFQSLLWPAPPHLVTTHALPWDWCLPLASPQQQPPLLTSSVFKYAVLYFLPSCPRAKRICLQTPSKYPPPHSFKTLKRVFLIAIFFFCQWLSSHVPRLLPVYHSNHYCFIVPFCFSICLQSKHERQEDSKLSRARFVIFQLFPYSCRTSHVRVLLQYQNHQGLWLL